MRHYYEQLLNLHDMLIEEGYFEFDFQGEDRGFFYMKDTEKGRFVVRLPEPAVYVLTCQFTKKSELNALPYTKTIKSDNIPMTKQGIETFEQMAYEV